MNYILLNHLTQFAQADQSYNCGAYGEGSYNTNENCTTVADSTTNGLGLADTGTNVVIGVAGGVLLIIVAVVIFVTTRRKRSKNK